MKFKITFPDEALLERLEKVFKKYDSKLRFGKMGEVECGMGEGIITYIKINPICKNKKVDLVFVLEKLEEDLNKYLNYKTNVHIMVDELHIYIEP